METQTDKKICESCEGTGKEIYSCCGDEMQGSIYEDIGLCPTCKEHNRGECGECRGTGIGRTEFISNLRVNDGDKSFEKAVAAYGETEEESMKAIKKYCIYRKWVIEEVYSIKKLE